MIDVVARDELREGEFTVVRAGRREVGIVLWRGEVHALANRCPHMGAPVCRGRVTPLVDEALPRAALRCAGDDAVLSCPWHGWEFRIDSGVAVADSHYRLRRYRAEVRDGRVLVELGG